jgi:predicted RNase H-like HicB family nuclease
MPNAKLGAKVDRYSFFVRLLPPLLHTGLARRTNIAIAPIGTGLGEDLRWHWLRQIVGRRRMGNHAVTLRVTPLLRIECKFWLTDDGWSGSCAQPSIAVQAGSFEHAKSEMEIALGKHIEGLLREAQQSNKGQAA